MVQVFNLFSTWSTSIIRSLKDYCEAEKNVIINFKFTQPADMEQISIHLESYFFPTDKI